MRRFDTTSYPARCIPMYCSLNAQHKQALFIPCGFEPDRPGGAAGAAGQGGDLRRARQSRPAERPGDDATAQSNALPTCAYYWFLC